MGSFFAFTVPGTAVWAPRLAAAVSRYVGVLLFGVALLLLLLFGHYVIADMRRRARAAVRRALLEAVKQYRKAASPGQAAAVRVQNAEALSERRGLSVITQTADGLDAEGCQALRDILLNMGFSQRLSEQLDSDNDDYLAEIISLVGDLDLVGLDGRVAALLYTHKDSLELQYRAFLTLSRLGSSHIARVCMDKSFVQTLSFRSLQQVLAAYAGDKAELYGRLLSAPDPHLVRIALKQVGLTGLHALAGQVTPWLNSENSSIQIDAVRTLGLLRYAPAAMPIASLLRHERWEVRSVAVTAAAAIDAPAFTDALIAALQDSEWQVRYNAALALQQLPGQALIKDRVAASQDRYALEMYEYMARMAGMWRNAQ